MFSKALVIMAFASAALAAAMPQPALSYPDDVEYTVYADGLPEGITSSKRDLEERGGNAGVYLCNDRNFSGYCVHIVAPTSQCVNLGGDLNDQVSAVGPDKPAYCIFYSAYNCQDSGEGHFGTFSPGYQDLSSSGTPGSYWDNRISSYFCTN